MVLSALLPTTQRGYNPQVEKPLLESMKEGRLVFCLFIFFRLKSLPPSSENRCFLCYSFIGKIRPEVKGYRQYLAKCETCISLLKYGSPMDKPQTKLFAPTPLSRLPGTLR